MNASFQLIPKMAWDSSVRRQQLDVFDHRKDKPPLALGGWVHGYQDEEHGNVSFLSH